MSATGAASKGDGASVLGPEFWGPLAWFAGVLMVLFVLFFKPESTSTESEG